MNKNILLNGEISESDKNILKTYLEIAGVIFVVLDRQGNIISLNKELSNILKLDVGDIRGKNWFENFLPKKDIGWVKNIFLNLMKGNTSPETEIIENNIVDKYGKEKRILWHNAVINNKDGKILGTISSGMDITDKVRMEEEQFMIIDILRLLNNSDSKIDLIKEILCFIKKHSGFEAVGIRLKEGDDYPYYDTLGFSDEFVAKETSLCSNDIKEMINYEDGNSCLQCLCGAIIMGKTKNFDDYCFTEKGTFWSNDLSEMIDKKSEKLNTIIDNRRNRCYNEGYRSMALIPIVAGVEIIGLLQLNDHKPYIFSNSTIKFYENIVETIGIALYRINIEEEMKKTGERISKINKELEDFAYKASHDLREPLRTITSYVEILEDDIGSNLTEKQKNNISKIIEASSLMDNFINDLLSYSRVGIINKKEDVNLEDICEAAKISHESLINEKNGTIIYNNLPTIKASGLLMAQLFQNLLSNALKYNRDGVDPIINIYVEDKSSHWEISIKDNGMGIDKKNYDSIFKMFQRITPNKYRGTGMGLAICKKIVESFGGKIWFDSEINSGTTFYFTLPKN